MPKLLIFDAFTLLIREKNVAIYALLRCKIFSLKIWECKILDKYHVCAGETPVDCYDCGANMKKQQNNFLCSEKVQCAGNRINNLQTTDKSINVTKF